MSNLGVFGATTAGTGCSSSLLSSSVKISNLGILMGVAVLAGGLLTLVSVQVVSSMNILNGAAGAGAAAALLGERATTGFLIETGFLNVRSSGCEQVPLDGEGLDHISCTSFIASLVLTV
uniref:Uncharacterized protein n=1 Tax=Cacopsylla melanoneura TaxID=428564 RepID=A0A8D9ANL5_9HEMI